MGKILNVIYYNGNCLIIGPMIELFYTFLVYANYSGHEIWKSVWEGTHEAPCGARWRRGMAVG